MNNVSNRQEPWLHALFGLYFFFIPFVRLFYLPVVHAKIQPTELIFLILAPLVGWKLWQERPWRWRTGWKRLPRAYRALIISGIVYVAVNGISAYLSGDQDAQLEAVGRCYLVLLAVLIGWWTLRGGKQVLRTALWAWLWGAVVMAGLTVVGYGLTLLGFANRTVALIENYPYFGTAYRVMGLTSGGGMYALVLMVPTLYAWWRWRSGTGPFWPWALLVITLLLSLSKEVVLVLLGMGLLEASRHQWSSTWRSIFLANGIALFLLGTHFLFLPQQRIDDSYLNDTEFTSEEVWGQWGSLQVVGTSYTTLKKAAWHMGRQHLWWGVGPGQHYKHLSPLREQGIYPEHLPDYESHSSWLGAWAETGPLGLLSLLAIVVVVWRIIVNSDSIVLTDELPYLLTVYLLLILVESISVDTMNFRHLWAPLGLLLGYQLNQTYKSSPYPKIDPGPVCRSGSAGRPRTPDVGPQNPYTFTRLH